MTYPKTLLLVGLLLLSGCYIEPDSAVDTAVPNPLPTAEAADLYTVTSVIDGDTIDVRKGEVTYRVRYVGVNTPERDEDCYDDAVTANRDLVRGQQVRLVQDESNTDRFGRLLRYVYVGDVFVNERLIAEGYAEVVRYDPDDRYYNRFRDLEEAAAEDDLGCHPTGIFDDGSMTR
ncbi:MAG: thermonuclease family protein [Armatimonadetes bacterium]|nr:thermonuclease family protein [Anaerolineae bacterium]